jgi:hypothetical protein
MMSIGEDSRNVTQRESLSVLFEVLLWKHNIHPRLLVTTRMLSRKQIFRRCPWYLTPSIPNILEAPQQLPELPEDVLKIIFAYLPFRDWFNVMITCKKYNRLGRQIFDPSYKNNWPIIQASLLGYTTCVRYLLTDPRVDPTAQCNVAVRAACENGHMDVVKVLILDGRVDPAINNNCVIGWASERGDLELVRYLLKHPRVNPAANGNNALKMALTNGHMKAAKELMTDARVQDGEAFHYVHIARKRVRVD